MFVSFIVYLFSSLDTLVFTVYTVINEIQLLASLQLQIKCLKPYLKTIIAIKYGLQFLEKNQYWTQRWIKPMLQLSTEREATALLTLPLLLHIFGCLIFAAQVVLSLLKFRWFSFTAEIFPFWSLAFGLVSYGNPVNPVTCISDRTSHKHFYPNYTSE